MPIPAVDLRVHGATLHAVMPADVRSIEPLCQAAREHIARQGGADESFALILGMREALLNAVCHGAGGDAAKYVLLELTVTPQDATLTVEDPGPGFDWRARSAEPPPPEAVSGRGLPIMHSCYDAIAFNPKGNRIRLFKRFRSDTPMSASIRQGEVARMTPGRDIVAAAAAELKVELKALVDAGVQRVELDCTGVTMVDSVGIGLLIATHNSLKLLGGGLALHHVDEDIANLFRTMRLDKHFDVLTDGD